MRWAHLKWLLPAVLAAASPLAAQQAACSYQLSQLAFLVSGASQNATINVTVTAAAGQTCSWSFSTTASWIHINTSGVGTGAFVFAIDANSGTLLRQGTLTFQAPNPQNPSSPVTATITVYQTAATCTYVLAPTTTEIPVGGTTTGILQVTTGCQWSAGTSQAWITATVDQNNLYSTTNGITTSLGNGNIDYTVTANSCVASRQAIIGITAVPTVPGVPPVLTVTQDGSNSNLTLSQSSLSTGTAAATGSLTVTTGSGCAWGSISTDSSWLQISSTTAQSGPGTVFYSVLANTGPARTGTITVGPQKFVVTQQGVSVPVPVLTALVNAADYASGAISPGEIVALGGSNMGPVQGVPYQLSANGKSIPNSLGGVQVLFGGNPATLLYVSATQINAIVPYEVAGTASTTVQVQYQGQTVSMTVPVQAATPAIFSQDQSGLGPGAILNQDNSVNTSLSPAAVGSVIQIYATGGGITTPAVADGLLTPYPPLPLLVTQPVTVTIGGLPAQVNYAGGAPGLVAGLTQIDATVPAGVATGLAVPVVVQIGTAQSQAGLTITVR